MQNSVLTKRKGSEHNGFLLEYPTNKKRQQIPQEELENKCLNLAFW